MQSFKFYALGFAVVVITSLISTGVQIAAGYLPDNQIITTLVANLSGITIGSIIMVIGFLRDNRLVQEQERTAQERQRADAAEARAAQERQRADARAAEERARADRLAAEERQRADAAEARIQEERARADRLADEMTVVRQQYTDATEALIKRLQELDDRDATRRQSGQ